MERQRSIVDLFASLLLKWLHQLGLSKPDSRRQEFHVGLPHELQGSKHWGTICFFPSTIRWELDQRRTVWTQIGPWMGCQHCGWWLTKLHCNSSRYFYNYERLKADILQIDHIIMRLMLHTLEKTAWMWLLLAVFDIVHGKLCKLYLLSLLNFHGIFNSSCNFALLIQSPYKELFKQIRFIHICG